MKKRLLLVLAFAFAMATTYAQMSIGFTGGLNFAKVGQNYADSEDEDDVKMRIAPRIGVLVDFGLSDAIAFRTGLAYSSKGYKSEESGSETAFGETYSWESKTTAIVNYLEIPLTGVYKTGSLEITAGPYLAFGMGGKVKYEGSQTYNGETDSYSEESKIGFAKEISESQEDDEKEYIRGMDLGITLGVGYKVGPGVIGLSYSKGLSNLTAGYASDPDYDPADHKMTNTAITLSFTYFLKK